MGITKRIVCLANSRKPGGTCVAGKEVSDKKTWIRPIGIHETGSVSARERRYDDGSEPALRDIIDVPLKESCPKGCQTENWLLSDERWKKVQRVGWEQLSEFLDDVDVLWINGSDTKHGINDEMEESVADTLESSLYLISVDCLTIIVLHYGRKLRVQAQFRYRSVDYGFWVTDPRYESIYKKEGVGEYSLGESFLTVSIGEPIRKGYSRRMYCYKLVAAIFERENMT